MGGRMKLKQLFSFSSRSSSSGSLEQGKKDFHTQYMVKEQLGKGGFGVVYSAVRRCDGLEVAVKEVNKDERVVIGNGNLPLEVALMQQLQDVPGVIRFIDYFDMQTCFYIVMERSTARTSLTSSVSRAPCLRPWPRTSSGSCLPPWSHATRRALSTGTSRTKTS